MNAVYLVAIVAALLATAVVSARAARCNWRRFQHARVSPPLLDIDVSGSEVRPIRMPTGWPAVEDVDDRAVAAAYAALADDRMLTASLLSEVLYVAAGAAAGAAAATLFNGKYTSLPTMLGSVVLLFGGLILRMRATRIYEPVSARYRARYAALTATPDVPPSGAPRRPFWGGLVSAFARRTRQTAQDGRSGRPM